VVRPVRKSGVYRKNIGASARRYKKKIEHQHDYSGVTFYSEKLKRTVYMCRYCDAYQALL
jgi:hypothetical protein